MARFSAVLVTAFVLFAPVLAYAGDFVDGHNKKDGSWVAPHWRSTPNSSHSSSGSGSSTGTAATSQHAVRAPRGSDSWFTWPWSEAAAHGSGGGKSHKGQ